MYVTWTVCLALLFILAVTIWVKYYKGWVQNMYYFCSYVVYTRTAVIYGAVMVVYVLCILYNVGVAEALGEKDLFVRFFQAYPCAGISVKYLPAHELHQHGIHIAGWAASDLPAKGYYYVPLTHTNIKYEGDGMLFNPITNHKVVIQCKAGVYTVVSYDTLHSWLQEYAAHTHHNTTAVYEQQWYDYIVSKMFPRLGSGKTHSNIHMDCITYNINIAWEKSSALELEEAIAIHSTVVDNAAYNEFVQAYLKSQGNTQGYTDNEIIAEFTQGLRMFLGKEQVAVLSEM